MIDIEGLFKNFDSSEKAVNSRNKDALELFLRYNIAQIVYLDNGTTKMVVVSSNKELIRIFKEKSSTVTKNITKKITKKFNTKTKDVTSLEIKTFDFIKEKTFSIPLKNRWKIIRWVTITDKNMEEINNRMRGVFVENKNTKNKDKNK